MTEYDFQVREQYSSLLDDIETDEKEVGNDAQNHISEMPFINGPSVAKYGGEFPWIHIWDGFVRTKRVPEYMAPSEASDIETVESVMSRVMPFFQKTSTTPHKTDVDDFQWTVRVVESDYSLIKDTVKPIQIIWVPK